MSTSFHFIHVPSFLGTTIIREHHVVGFPGGTGSMIPRQHPHLIEL